MDVAFLLEEIEADRHVEAAVAELAQQKLSASDRERTLRVLDSLSGTQSPAIGRAVKRSRAAILAR